MIDYCESCAQMAPLREVEVGGDMFRVCDNCTEQEEATQ